MKKQNMTAIQRTTIAEPLQANYGRAIFAEHHHQGSTPPAPSPPDCTSAEAPLAEGQAAVHYSSRRFPFSKPAVEW